MSLNPQIGKKISIICPVFNEEKAIPLFYKRLKAVLNNLSEYEYELIFTNNSSTDGTLQEIIKLNETDPRVHWMTFSRNFGYQASILAGIIHATGQALVIIDVDCEDPPEMIQIFVEKWKEGYDICYGIRRKRQEFFFVTWLRLVFYRILKKTADTDIILDMAEFSLMSRHVRNSLIKNKNTYPFIRAEIAYSGFKKIGVPYDRQKRIVGKSNYNFKGMFLFAIAGILSVSTFPLRMAVYILPVIIFINTAGLICDLMDFGNYFRPLMILDLLFLMACLSSQGLYIARIYKNGIGRPVYIVNWEQSDTRLISK